MLSAVWSALGDLKPGQAVMLTGFVGFLTLTGGHLFSAWLSRRRDNRLDSLQRKRAVQAFAAELTVVQTQLELCRIVFDINKTTKELTTTVPKCSSYTPFRADLIKNLSMLNDKQIISVANIYAHFDYFDAFVIKSDENGYKSIDIGSSIKVQGVRKSFGGLLDLIEQTIRLISESRDAFLKADIFHTDRERELYASVLKDVLVDVTSRVSGR